VTHRQEAIEWARNLLKLNPFFLDTETTGTGRDAEIVSIAIMDRDEAILYSGFIRPRNPIDELGEACRGNKHTGGTFKGNGITNAMVKDAPTFKELWNQKDIHDALNYSSCCAYNSEFDGRMIHQEVGRFTNSPCFEYWKCAMKAYAQFVGEEGKYKGSYKWHKLTEACTQLGIPFDEEQAHGSLYDTLLLVRVVKGMAESE